MADASYPDDLLYHAEHDWVRIDGDVATFGITWYAQDSLGEVVFFDPPEVGKEVKAGEPYAEIESVKAVSDVIAPLSGEVLEVNKKVVDEPETVNEDPYGEGWLVRIRLSDPSEVDTLLALMLFKTDLSVIAVIAVRSRLWPLDCFRAVRATVPALVVIVVKLAHVERNPNRCWRPTPPAART